MRHYLDIESSGLNYWTNSIISLAWIITDDNNDKVAEFYDECAPDKGSKVWNMEAEKIHKFTEIDQRKKQPALDMCKKLLEFWKVNKVTDANIRYHANANFDTRHLFAMFFKAMEHNYYDLYKYINPSDHVNTIPLVKSKISLKSYSLDSIANYLNIPLAHHNALSDTNCLVGICKELTI